MPGYLLGVYITCGSLALLPSLAVGCGRTASDQAAAAPTVARAEFVCAPRGAGASDGGCRFLRPPGATIDGRPAYKLTNIAGDSLWLILPGRTHEGDIYVFPGAPIRLSDGNSPRVGLSAAGAEALAIRHCSGMQDCDPEPTDRTSLPNDGRLTRWADGAGKIRDLGLTTVEFGEWTLSISGGTPAQAELIARALSWRVDRDRFILLRTTLARDVVDRELAQMFVLLQDPERHAYYNLLEVLSGCQLSTKTPDLGGTDADEALDIHEPDTVSGGRWCSGERYWIDAAWVTPDRLRDLFESIEVVAAPSGSSG